MNNQNDGRFNKIVAVLIAVVTAVIALVTFAQADAAARDDAANRDSKRYSLEAFGKQVSGDARVNFDYNRAYQAYYELDLLAASAEAVGDAPAAQRYRALRDDLTSLSPLLAPPYFDAAAGAVNLAKYEADTYLADIVQLQERFTAASSVKEAWDKKANTYIIHLTLLAVALFLYGLSATISSHVTRWIFAGMGTAVSVVAVGWAAAVYMQPVKDLRECRTADGAYAIDVYAQGVGLAHQQEYEPAVQAYDKALACEPSYVNALVQRAEANTALGNFGAAAADYEKARAAGDATGNTAGSLAWVYYLLGRFDDAAAMNRIALAASPGELWIQYDLALSLLASGKFDEARAEYNAGMELAAKQVADARAAGAEPPSYLWWGLEDAALSLDELLINIAEGAGAPPPVAIAEPDKVTAAGEEISTRLKSLSVGLEFTGAPPKGGLTAKISPFTFASPVLDDQGNTVDYEPADTFEYGTREVSVLFDYEDMLDGQDVLFKVYVDGEEDPSWRLIDAWSLGAFGSAEKPLSLSYSNTQVFAPGTYTVEMYIDSHLAQSGQFLVQQP